jgi:hypothetical protein
MNTLLRPAFILLFVMTLMPIEASAGVRSCAVDFFSVLTGQSSALVKRRREISTVTKLKTPENWPLQLPPEDGQTPFF